MCVEISSKDTTIESLESYDHAAAAGGGLLLAAIIAPIQPAVNDNFGKHVHSTVEVFGIGNLADN